MDEDEVIRQTNANEHGLAGSVWSRDVMRVARGLRTGMVAINSNGGSGVFGGYKVSGPGREIAPAKHCTPRLHIG